MKSSIAAICIAGTLISTPLLAAAADEGNVVVFIPRSVENVRWADRRLEVKEDDAFGKYVTLPFKYEDYGYGGNTIIRIASAKGVASSNVDIKKHSNKERGVEYVSDSLKFENGGQLWADGLALAGGISGTITSINASTIPFSATDMTKVLPMLTTATSLYSVTSPFFQTWHYLPFYAVREVRERRKLVGYELEPEPSPRKVMGKVMRIRHLEAEITD